MEKTGISGLQGKLPSRISGGEAQRAALVRALVNKPSMLLADEPTGSLDSKNAIILANLLVELNRETGITLLLSTHSAELAGKMALRFVIEDGKLKG
jgi:ABC-type lipoprotein export system ATPase subunit